MNVELDRLQRKLGHSFRDLDRLELALSHRSVGANNNERLEFLGDSILGLVIAEALFQKFPKAKEGQLTRLRAQLVREETLAEIAREMALGDCLHLGGGELKSGGFRRASILADAVEALIGAIYLESGLEHTRECLLGWYSDRLDQLSSADALKDSKTCLQEFLQGRRLSLPRYELVSVEGQPHAQTFSCECHVEGLSAATLGVGPSRRIAEQEAARRALALLQPEKS